jgi:serine/threonine protein kinase
VVKTIACRSVNQANQALLEAACLQRLRHPGVVRFDEVFLHRHERGGCSAVIVMEFCGGGDLNDRLECSRGEAPLTERQHISYLEQLVAALKHVHAAGIEHRDMNSKPKPKPSPGPLSLAQFLSRTRTRTRTLASPCPRQASYTAT